MSLCVTCLFDARRSAGGRALLTERRSGYVVRRTRYHGPLLIMGRRSHRGFSALLYTTRVRFASAGFKGSSSLRRARTLESDPVAMGQLIHRSGVSETLTTYSLP